MSKPIIVLDAGHGLSTPGKRCLKKIDQNQTREWQLNSRIANRLTQLLSTYDCTVLRVDDITGKKDISLLSRTTAANKSNADIYISIHHNAGVNGGSGGGTTLYYYSSNPDRQKQAQSIYNHIIAKTGLVGNRSSKVIKKGFYVLAHTKMPAFLIENGYMDSSTDVPIILSAEHAEKTAQGILNFLVENLSLQKNGTTTPQSVIKDLGTTVATQTSSTNSSSIKYTYKGVNYSPVFDPSYYSAKYPDLKKAYGTNATRLFNHFCNYGMIEGRIAKTTFNVIAYKNNYADLRKTFGNNLPDYYKHYCQYGQKENRRAT